MNRYIYARDNPESLSDPSGHMFTTGSGGGSPSDTGSGANDFLTCNITRCGTVSGGTDPGSMTTGYGITNTQSCGYFGCLSNADNAGGPQTGEIIGHSQNTHIPDFYTWLWKTHENEILLLAVSTIASFISPIFRNSLTSLLSGILTSASIGADVRELFDGIQSNNRQEEAQAIGGLLWDGFYTIEHSPKIIAKLAVFAAGASTGLADIATDGAYSGLEVTVAFFQAIGSWSTLLGTASAEYNGEFGQ